MKNEVTTDDDDRASHNVSFAVALAKFMPQQNKLTSFCSINYKSTPLPNTIVKILFQNSAAENKRAVIRELHAATNLPPKNVFLAPNG
jgi:hypothetical protein